MKRTLVSATIAMSIGIVACMDKKDSVEKTNPQIKSEQVMSTSNKQKVVELLKSIETGDQAPVSYINPNKYIQHNLQVGDGLAGFGELMKNKPEGGFKVNTVRAFEDGDFVFTHTEYDFFGPLVGFDIFRFEEGLIVEHWDNLSPITAPNPSGRTQLDGETEVTDLGKTDKNKKLVNDFIQNVLQEGKTELLTTYINDKKYLQHNSNIADGLEGLGQAFSYFTQNKLIMEYETVHKILGQGNFVLAISEGKFGKGDHVAFYDLFRIENDKIVEHWDIIENIPSRSEWKNENGKF